MAADQDAIKQLPPNIRSLKKEIRKDWARKLIPAVKAKSETEANRLIAMATGLEPRSVAGIRGDLKGTTPPPRKPKSGKPKGKKKTVESEWGTEERDPQDADDTAKQVIDQVTKLFGQRLGKLEKTVELALTGRGNGGPKTITMEEPALTLELTGNDTKLNISPLVQMYYAYSMKAADQKGMERIPFSEWINRVVEGYYREKGLTFAVLKKENVVFVEPGDTV